MHIKSLILKINSNEKVKWEEHFPSVFGEKKFNGNNARNINLAIKELQKSPLTLTEIRNKAKEMDLMYYISPNNHTGRWGLDKKKYPRRRGNYCSKCNLFRLYQ